MSNVSTVSNSFTDILWDTSYDVPTVQAMLTAYALENAHIMATQP